MHVQFRVAYMSTVRVQVDDSQDRVSIQVGDMSLGHLNCQEHFVHATNQRGCNPIFVLAQLAKFHTTDLQHPAQFISRTKCPQLLGGAVRRHVFAFVSCSTFSSAASPLNLWSKDSCCRVVELCRVFFITPWTPLNVLLADLPNSVYLPAQCV